MGKGTRGTLAVALLAASAGAAPAAAAPRSCGFAVVGGTQVNALFPDAAATYWVANLPIPPGGYVELHGAFPHARYTSLTTYTSQQQSIDGLSDREILPDPGSVNPFLPGADRTAADRAYTVKVVRAQKPAEGRAPNTIYTTSADGSKSGGQATQRMSLRIYEGDRGTGREGGVPLPDITLVTSDGQRTALPPCPYPDVPDTGLVATLANAGTGTPMPANLNPRAENPPVWHKFTGTAESLTRNDLGGRAPEGGFGDNPDNKYVSANLSQGFGQVVEFVGKAPTFPRTYDGEPVMGTGDMRYWSFCENSQATSFYACLQDDQVPVDRHGFYRVVISTATARPRNATESCGVGWIPSGPIGSSVLIPRNMQPDPAFAHSIQRAELGTEAAVMGDYYPKGIYYPTTTDYEKTGCHRGGEEDEQ